MTILLKKSLVLTSVLFVTLFASILSHAEIAIIANKSSKLTTTKIADIERVYLGKRKSLTGVSVTPLNQDKVGEMAKSFNKIVLNKTSKQVQSYWSKLIFTGKGTPPEEFLNDAEVINAVKEDPNAIGYIDAKSVDGSIKVLLKF